MKILQDQLEENHQFVFGKDWIDNKLTGKLKEKSFFKIIKDFLKEIIINKSINKIRKKLDIKEYLIILESQD